jgi:hypothetical protein
MTQTQEEIICRYCGMEKEPDEVQRCTVNWKPGWKCKDDCKASLELHLKQKEASDGNSSIQYRQ